MTSGKINDQSELKMIFLKKCGRKRPKSIDSIILMLNLKCLPVVPPNKYTVSST